jgi:RNA polymerase sigma-70 factor, ECF subfamily
VDQRRLVERAREGDHDAFAELVHGCVARLDTAARLILRDGELARDAVQEGLFRAWRDLRSLRDPDRFDAWVYRLTVNVCLDLMRRRRRRPLEIGVIEIVEPALPDQTEEVADRALVDGVMRRLGDRDRSVIVLHYFLDLPISEVAICLGIPEGTVKSRLHHALRAMRSDALEAETAVSLASKGTLA